MIPEDGNLSYKVSGHGLTAQFQQPIYAADQFVIFAISLCLTTLGFYQSWIQPETQGDAAQSFRLSDISVVVKAML